MQKFNKIFFGFICLILFFSISDKALAAKDCRCATDLDAVANSTALFKQQSKVLKSQCLEAKTDECNITDKAAITKGKLNPDCWRSADVNDCTTRSQEWQVRFDSMLAEGKIAAETGATQAVPTGESALSALIGKCGLKIMAPECWDVTVFIRLLLQMTKYLFSIIGALALGAFVYGGFVLILSQGNPEKVKQGTGAMVNAVIGLLIAFGGYVLVGFLGEILKLKSDFGLLK